MEVKYWLFECLKGNSLDEYSLQCRSQLLKVHSHGWSKQLSELIDSTRVNNRSATLQVNSMRFLSWSTLSTAYRDIWDLLTSLVCVDIALTCCAIYCLNIYNKTLQPEPSVGKDWTQGEGEHDCRVCKCRELRVLFKGRNYHEIRHPKEAVTR